MKTQNIPSTLIEGLESQIRYQYSRRMFVNAAMFFAMTLISVLALVFFDIDQKSPLYFVLGLAAVIGVIIGATTLIFTKKQPVVSATHQPLQCYSYHFDATQSVVNDDISACRFDRLKSLINKHDAGVRLDLITTADGSIAQYRIYKYVPFEYQPVSEVIKVDAKAAQAIASLGK